MDLRAASWPASDSTAALRSLNCFVALLSDFSLALPPLAYCSLVQLPETLAKPATTWSSRSITVPRLAAVAGALSGAWPSAGRERQQTVRPRQTNDAISRFMSNKNRVAAA